MDWLFKIGVGWIGWTEDQTLDSTLFALVKAHEGRTDMLKAIFGSEDKPKEKPNTEPASGSKILSTLRSFIKRD